MAENDSSSTEVHIYKPDEQGNTVIIEGEKYSTNNGDPNSSNVSESHHQKEQIIIENPNDPLSTITHRLEDIHVTVNNETSAPVEAKAHDKLNEAANAVNEKTTELKNDAAASAHNVQENVKEAAHDVQEKATEVKQDAAAAAHVVGEKAEDAAHVVQEKATEVKQDAVAAAHVVGEKAKDAAHDASVVAHDATEKGKEVAHNVQEKVSEVAANTKDALVAGEKAAEVKLAAAKETVIEKSNEVVDSAKHAAHDASVKTQELAESAGEQLKAAEKIGEQKFEDTKQYLSEKGSEVIAKGSEILDSTKQALATGAAVVTEKAKQGIELASEAASNVKAATGQLAADAQAKVVETASTVKAATGQLAADTQAKVVETAHNAQVKAAAAADVIATKAVDVKDTTVATSKAAASTVQEKTSTLLDSTKQVLSSSSPQPTPVVPLGTDHITQEAYVTETSGQTTHGPEPVASTTTKSSKGGPINAIRNFFNRIFNSSSQRHEDRQKSGNVTVQTTETEVVTTTATVATSNPPRLS